MIKPIATLLVLVISVTLNAQTVKPIYVVHVNLGNTQLSQNVVEELLRPNANFKNRPVILLRPNLDVKENPFAVSRWGRQTGLTRQNGEIKYDQTPVLTNRMTAWFEDLERKDIHPEVFIINGHHLVGMGFESDNTWETNVKSQFGETIELANRSLYMQTIVRSREYHPVVKKFFDGIKLVFIGGCEGLTNLEPKEFGLSGRALSSEEIKTKYFAGDKNLLLGNVAQGTGLAGYKADLVRVYPGEYTFNDSDEVCVDKANGLHCEVHNVNRILPDSGLWDGQHMYNLPLQMKKLFPRAYAVFGFNTPSPTTPGVIWKSTFNETREKLMLNNFFQPLLSDETPSNLKQEIIQRMRISWTRATQQLNKRSRNGKVVNRISGSITPAFPELDKNGLFAYEVGAKDFAEAPAFAPYEIREGFSSTNQVVRETVQKRDVRVIEAKPPDSTYSPTEQEDPLFHLIERLNK